MKKWLIIFISLLVVPVCGTAKQKHESHKVVKHSTKPVKQKNVAHKLHVKKTSGGKHAKAATLTLAALSDEKIATIMDKFKVPDSKQRPIISAINAASKKHNVNKGLIVAIIARESSFKQYAVSGAGAQGLMQIMPEHKVPNPFQIHQNIDFGTALLARYINDAGNLNKGLSLYGNSDAYIGELNSTIKKLNSYT